jgi:hypothetical protein
VIDAWVARDGIGAVLRATGDWDEACILHAFESSRGGRLESEDARAIAARPEPAIQRALLRLAVAKRHEPDARWLCAWILPAIFEKRRASLEVFEAIVLLDGQLKAERAFDPDERRALGELCEAIEDAASRFREGRAVPARSSPREPAALAVVDQSSEMCMPYSMVLAVALTLVSDLRRLALRPF